MRSRRVETLTLSAGGGLPLSLFEPDGRVRGTVAILHGRNGGARAPQIVEIAAAWLRRGWRAAVPDLRFSDGNDAPGGGPEFTMSAHLEDGRAALARARTIAGDAPFALAGHSMGAWAAALLAAETPAAALLAVSPVVSGEALLAARRAMGADAVEALRREAPLAFEEWPGRDARPALARLAAPVAVVVGADDGLTPPADARAFFDAAPEGRFFAVAPGQHHCPIGPTVARLFDAALEALGA